MSVYDWLKIFEIVFLLVEIMSSPGDDSDDAKTSKKAISPVKKKKNDLPLLPTKSVMVWRDVFHAVPTNDPPPLEPAEEIQNLRSQLKQFKEYSDNLVAELKKKNLEIQKGEERINSLLLEVREKKLECLKSAEETRKAQIGFGLIKRISSSSEEDPTEATTAQATKDPLRITIAEKGGTGLWYEIPPQHVKTAPDVQPIPFVTVYKSYSYIFALTLSTRFFDVQSGLLEFGMENMTKKIGFMSPGIHTFFIRHFQTSETNQGLITAKYSIRFGANAVYTKKCEFRFIVIFRKYNSNSVEMVYQSNPFTILGTKRNPKSLNHSNGVFSYVDKNGSETISNPVPIVGKMTSNPKLVSTKSDDLDASDMSKKRQRDELDDPENHPPKSVLINTSLDTLTESLPSNDLNGLRDFALDIPSIDSVSTYPLEEIPQQFIW